MVYHMNLLIRAEPGPSEQIFLSNLSVIVAMKPLPFYVILLRGLKTVPEAIRQKCVFLYGLISMHFLSHSSQFSSGKEYPMG